MNEFTQSTVLASDFVEPKRKTIEGRVHWHTGKVEYIISEHKGGTRTVVHDPETAWEVYHAL